MDHPPPTHALTIDVDFAILIGGKYLPSLPGFSWRARALMSPALSVLDPLRKNCWSAVKARTSISDGGDSYGNVHRETSRPNGVVGRRQAWYRNESAEAV